MPLYVNEICIGLHSKCNWCCKYCVARWDDAEINEDQIIEEIEPIKDKLRTLWLSGGEPGLLSVQFWNYLFYSSEYPLSICTNGTFIRRGYADLFRSKIRRLMIHCVQEMDQDINPFVLQFIRKSRISKIVNTVIHKNNTHLIYDFLNKYKDIQFEFNFADQTFAEINNQYNKEYDCAMDRTAVISVIRELGKLGNYGKYTNFLAKKLIQNDFKHLNPWSYKNHD
jgi:organic radical activating enzyme